MSVQNHKHWPTCHLLKGGEGGDLGTLGNEFKWLANEVEHDITRVTSVWRTSLRFINIPFIPKPFSQPHPVHAGMDPPQDKLDQLILQIYNNTTTTAAANNNDDDNDDCYNNDYLHQSGLRIQPISDDSEPRKIQASWLHTLCQILTGIEWDIDWYWTIIGFLWGKINTTSRSKGDLLWSISPSGVQK